MKYQIIQSKKGGVFFTDNTKDNPNAIYKCDSKAEAQSHCQICAADKNYAKVLKIITFGRSGGVNLYDVIGDLSKLIEGWNG